MTIVDSTETPVVYYSYDAWGYLINITGSQATILGTLNPIRYRGYYYDTETGYYYLQSRYYDPLWGRFINADEYVFISNVALCANSYAYCFNNPIAYIDNTGEFPNFNNIIKMAKKIIKIAVPIIRAITKPGYQGTEESYYEILVMLQNAVEKTKCVLSEGVLDFNCIVLSSGVVKVIATYEDAYLNGSDYMSSYIVEMYYGNNLDWANENQKYYDENRPKEQAAAIASALVGILPGLGDFITMVGIGITFNDDNYQVLINDMLVLSAKNTGEKTCGILHITDQSSKTKIYTYKGD